MGSTAADRWAWSTAYLLLMAGLAGLACVWFAYLARLWPAWSDLDRVLMIMAAASGLASIPLSVALRPRPSLQTWVIMLPIALGTWVLTHRPEVVAILLGLTAIRTLFGRRVLEAIQTPRR